MSCFHRLAWPAFSLNAAGSDNFLRYEAGEFRFHRCLAIVGRSGAGKSLFARTLAVCLPPGLHGTSRPSIDSIDHSGHVRTLDPMDLVMVPQSPSSALPQAISCKDLIREILSWRHPGTDDSGPEKLINEVGLEASQMANLQASQLSGGMAQRFALALALAAGGRIIILDEPSVGLDANNVEVLTTLIRHIITERNVGVVMLTHDARMRELADTCLQFERRGTIVSVNHRTKVS